MKKVMDKLNLDQAGKKIVPLFGTFNSGTFNLRMTNGEWRNSLYIQVSIQGRVVIHVEWGAAKSQINIRKH